MSTRKKARLLADRRGNAAVEFALVLPLFISCIVGVMEVGRLLWTQNTLQRSVEVAARCASVNATSCGTTAQVQSFAVSEAVGLKLTTSAFTVATAACGSQVTGNAQFQYLTSFLPMPALTLSAQACFPL
jgi:Flp pilus assembly protein TadG